MYNNYVNITKQYINIDLFFYRSQKLFSIFIITKKTNEMRLIDFYWKEGVKVDWFNNISTSLLSKDLDGLWVRQKEISNNLSNLETPGFKSRTVNFEDQLRNLMSDSYTTDSEQVNDISSVQPRTTISEEQSLRLDGNNVDVEKENIELARTQLNYEYSLRELSDYFARLKTAIDAK